MKSSPCSLKLEKAFVQQQRPIIVKQTNKIFKQIKKNFICDFLFDLWGIQKCVVGLRWWLSGKQSTCQCKSHGFDPQSRKIPHDRVTKPCATNTELINCNYWSLCSGNPFSTTRSDEKPVHCNESSPSCGKKSSWSNKETAKS